MTIEELIKALEKKADKHSFYRYNIIAIDENGTRYEIEGVDDAEGEIYIKIIE